MAEIDFDDFEEASYAQPQGGNGRYGRYINMAGAASSVALVLVLAVWGYQLAMRDVTGVPVMRALDGPMRVAPENPGGQEASNQGLSVNAVASTGIASPVADRVKLAPTATALTDEDAAGLAAPVASTGAETAKAADANAVVALGTITATANVAPAEDGDLPAVEEDPAIAAALAEATASVDLSGGIAKSLKPHARPGTGAAASAASVTEVVAATEIDPATIAIGTRLAQLGAFDTPEEAKAKWAALAGQFTEVMAGKSVVIQPAQSGGKTFYRLRAHGFDNEDDARRFCSVLLGGNADCIPVAQR
jgi:SPOR domain